MPNRIYESNASRNSLSWEETRTLAPKHTAKLRQLGLSYNGVQQLMGGRTVTNPDDSNIVSILIGLLMDGNTVGVHHGGPQLLKMKKHGNVEY